MCFVACCLGLAKLLDCLPSTAPNRCTCAGAGYGEYEAYEIKEINKTDKCQDRCEIQGQVRTDNDDLTGSATAQVAVYSITANSQLELLGTSSVTRGFKLDTISVNFRWHSNAQTVVLVYICSVTDECKVRWVDSEGKNTRQFCLGSLSNLCQLNRNSARIIANRTFHIFGDFTIETALPGKSTLSLHMIHHHKPFSSVKHVVHCFSQQDVFDPNRAFLSCTKQNKEKAEEGND